MNRKPLVVVSEPLEPHALEYLRQEAEVRHIDKTEIDAHIGQADGLVVRTYTLVTPALLDKAPRLKVVGRAGVALENIDVPECFSRGIAVVHSPGANTLAVVDFTMAMILQLNRRYWPLSGPVSAEQFHELRKQMFGRFLSGLTLGIVGAGRIGSRVGRAAAALGMTVLYNDIKPIDLDYAATAVEKDELYAASDIVTIHVPHTPLTDKFINAASLAKFKGGAQFINDARGQCVDYAALADAIRSGHISAAAIDCHDPEPPPPDYPMYAVMGDNVVLTPHVAARVPAAMEAMCDVVYDVVAVLEGRAPQFPAEEGSY